MQVNVPRTPGRIRIPVLMAMVTSALAATSVNGAQQGEHTEATVTAHVYETQKLKADASHLRKLQVPKGFRIQRFAEGLDNPRLIAVSDAGVVYVTQRTPGTLVMLQDLDGDGVADVQKTVLQIEQLHGIALRGRKMYLIDTRRLYVTDIAEDGSVAVPQTMIDDLPDAGQHADRSLAFGPDGMLYVSVGSTCNACQEPNRENATLLRVDPSNWKREIFASGLRNTIGFAWHPSSKRMYGFEHGIDDLGDDVPGEELNELMQGAAYGWPYVYEHGRFIFHPLPATMTQEEWARMSKEPVALYRAHSAPMQLLFYTGSLFPAEYRGDAFATMRGSWNRKQPSGYEVVRVRFDRDGKFVKFEPFITDFLQKQSGEYGYVGRPVGLALAHDGALLVGDDSNNVIYRIAYGGSKPSAEIDQELAGSLLKAKALQRIEVRSPAISSGGMIDDKYSDYGQKTSPPLSWSGIPNGTRSLVMMMEDPEAKSPVPFVHWIIANIPPTVSALPEGVPTEERALENGSAIQGSNSKSKTGYFGPRPLAGEPPHPYHFQIFALDTDLTLPSGYNRQALIKAMSGHVLAKGELVGKYGKKK